MTPADRTAIRRRLSIRGATRRPPARAGEPRAAGRSGHAPILAPLAATVAALGVGLGLVVARSRRERDAEPEPTPRHGGLSLLPDEPPGEGLRRIALEQLDLAIELLEGYPGGAEERTVHETRKAIKRLRGLLGLMRQELGPKRHARENAALRDCARRLSGARDSEVLLATLDGLIARDPDELSSSAAVARLRAELLAEREAAAAATMHDERLRREVIGDLHAIRARLREWEPRERDFLGAGLRRVYGQGRRRLAAARRAKRNEVEALHAWRRRVKDLRYAAETLDMRALARRADRLGETLGEEHDLALLAGVLRERPGHFAGERATGRALAKLISRRRRRLAHRALRDGKRLYRRPPGRFERRLPHTR
ncbi:MAG TPA: CHAD domain-containing protein [Solirubrobacteraceae bacterium]|jgi:CHAD domain-containing protein|nr:CHAD domain-containing protein [Solirubrobacteraceae bacterium]